MNPQGAQHYLRTKVLTATPEQLQLMLYDGAIRFAEQARPALQERKLEQSHTLITRAQKIVTELITTLKHEVNPELCAKLAGLYRYVYRKLVDANLKRDVEALDEAVRLLRYQRDTWQMLLQELARQKAAAVAARMDVPMPDERMEASISMHV